MRHHRTSACARKRVLLVDQFPVTRSAVSDWLRETSDLALCGEADNANLAFNAVGELKPDVVVTEVLAQQDLGFIRQLHGRYPRLPILVFSFRDEEWYAGRALEAGADGYLMKGVSRAGFLDGIRATMEGRIVLSPQMRARLLQKCTARRRTFPARSDLPRGSRGCSRGNTSQ